MEERSHRHILNLVTQMTITGLSANEIECALIPMMARNISSTMKPNTLTHDQTRYLKLILATHGRSIHLGHVWTALALMRSAGSGPNQKHALDAP
jgi:hypothetical protein